MRAGGGGGDEQLHRGYRNRNTNNIQLDSSTSNKLSQIIKRYHEGDRRNPVVLSLKPVRNLTREFGLSSLTADDQVGDGLFEVDIMQREYEIVVLFLPTLFLPIVSFVQSSWWWSITPQTSYTVL